MIVNLKTIGFEGEHHQLNHKSEELEGVLQDLIGSHVFEVDLKILPTGNSFHVQGHFHFSYDELCSKCGYEITVSEKNKINEFLVKEKERPRQTHSVHGAESLDHSESLPSVTYLTVDEFDLGEFLHEMVAFSMSSYPACQDTKVCEFRAHKVEAPVEEKTKGHPGFAALEKLKIDN